MLLQHLDRDLLISRLRLKQHDWPDVVFGFRPSPLVPPRDDRAVHGVLASPCSARTIGSLIISFAFEFLRGDAVQDVGVEARRSGELDDRARVYARLHLTSEAGHGIVASSTIISGR